MKTNVDKYGNRISYIRENKNLDLWIRKEESLDGEVVYLLYHNRNVVTFTKRCDAEKLYSKIINDDKVRKGIR